MNRIAAHLRGWQRTSTQGTERQLEMLQLLTMYRFAGLLVAGALLYSSAPAWGPHLRGWFLAAAGAMALFSLAQHFGRAIPTVVLTTLELVVAAVLVGMAPSLAQPLAVYLLVPALWAGLALRLPAAVPAAAGLPLAVGLLAAIIPSGWMWQPLALWGALSLATCLVGAWMAQMHERRAKSELEYDQALALLQRLAQVTRRLPHGLDRRATLEHLVESVHAVRPDAEVAVFTLQEASWTHEWGDPSAIVGPAAPGSAVWQTATSTGKPQSVHSSDDGPDFTRLLLPLRHRGSVGGVVVLTSRQAPFSRVDVRRIAAAIERVPVRLEASDVFSRVREQAISEERSRLSRQIHDGIAQDLAGLAYGLDVLADTTPEGQSRDAVAGTAADVRRLVEELRLSIFDLRTELDAGVRLGTSLTAYARQVGERSGLRVTVDVEDGAADVAPDLAHELMRIAQESVTNSRRHAGASHLWVSLRINSEGVLLRVSDDGGGLRHIGPSPAGDGVGLRIMRERAERVGATLSVMPRPGGGTVVTCTLGPQAIRTRVPQGIVSEAADAVEAQWAPAPAGMAELAEMAGTRVA